jgi:hypothetical protein
MFNRCTYRGRNRIRFKFDDNIIMNPNIMRQYIELGGFRSFVIIG